MFPAGHGSSGGPLMSYMESMTQHSLHSSGAHHSGGDGRGGDELANEEYCRVITPENDLNEETEEVRGMRCVAGGGGCMVLWLLPPGQRTTSTKRRRRPLLAAACLKSRKSYPLLQLPDA